MAHDIKPFKTADEQIEILAQRGLIIDDINEARQLLLNLNYYRISAYSLTLRKNDIFYTNVHFNDIMQIYDFDMELRASLLYLLEYIEVSIRTHIGYFHAKSYGALGYLDCSTFNDADRYKGFKKDYEKAINEYGNKEAFVKHHNEFYNGQFPFWALVELLPFGSLSRIFKNLEKKSKTKYVKIIMVKLEVFILRIGYKALLFSEIYVHIEEGFIIEKYHLV